MTTTGGALVLEITISTSDDPDRVCHRLAAAAARTPMSLATAFATGTQIFPTRLEAIGTRPIRLECAFASRGEPIGREMALEFLDALSYLDIDEAVIISDDGTRTRLLDDTRVAG